MSIRVLWLTKGLGPGGAERLLVEMAGRIDHDRFDVTAAYVLPWKDHLAGELEANGVRTVCLSRRDPDPWWPLRLRDLMARFDIVHAHSPVPAAVARVASRTMRRDVRPITMSTEHNTWTSHHAVTRWADRLTGRLDEATFAVTQEVIDSMSGAPADRAEVLTHGIDVAATAAHGVLVRDRMRTALGLADDEVAIGTVANLRPQKDYPNLLASARLLADRGVRFRIVAVGQGPLEAEVVGLRDALGLGDVVDLLGFRADAIDVMAACDAFVLASAWEGLPVAVMEALALGLPIVATEVGGLAESLDDTSAILVPPRDPPALADALASVISDPERRAELAAGASAASSGFDVGRAVERLGSRYEQLVTGPSSADTTPPHTTTPAADTTPGGSTSPASGSPPAANASTPAPRPPVPRPSGTHGHGRPHRLPDGYEIRPMIDGDRSAVIALLGASLGWADDARSEALFAWKHVDNPFGASPGWVAVHETDGIVGVRLFMRWRFRRGTTTLRGARAVDTATHPDHRGRGLFTALTLAAVDACRDDGVAWIFNTPNSESRPGYLKMGWREIGRLAAATRPTSPTDLIAIARSRVPAERWSLPLDVGTEVGAWLDAVPAADRPGAGSTRAVSSTDRTIRTDLDDEVVRWRYGLPALHYRVVEGDDIAVVVRLRRRGQGRELVVADHFGDVRAADRLSGHVAAQVGATHTLRLGRPDIRHGFVPLPRGGPILTWRAVADTGPPPLSNWDLRLGDIELF